MALSAEVQKLVTELQLVEHPEGGWYRETYRSPVKLQTEKGERHLATLIYYLLPAGVESRIHKVSWDEIWLWQGGGVLDVRSYGPRMALGLRGHGGPDADDEPRMAKGTRGHGGPGADYSGEKYQSHLLGHAAGAMPQHLMPAGTWFNAIVAEGNYVLAACMVAPGFDFADLEFG